MQALRKKTWHLKLDFLNGKNELTKLRARSAHHLGRVVAVLRLFVVDQAVRAEELLLLPFDIALVVSAITKRFEHQSLCGEGYGYSLVALLGVRSPVALRLRRALIFLLYGSGSEPKSLLLLGRSPRSASRGLRASSPGRRAPPKGPLFVVVVIVEAALRGDGLGCSLFSYVLFPSLDELADVVVWRRRVLGRRRRGRLGRRGLGGGWRQLVLVVVIVVVVLASGLLSSNCCEQNVC